MFRFIILIVWVGMPFIAYSQNGRVVVRNFPKGGGIELKWYFEELVYPEGVHVYRQKEGDPRWKKLTDLPVLIKPDVTAAQMQEDEDLHVWVNAVNHSVKTKQELEGLLYVKVMCKSFLSPVFADFMGIHYQDRAIQEGLIYRYKVNKLNRGIETPLGISAWVTSGKYSPEDKVEELEAEQVKSKVRLRWKPDEDRFFAYQVYRLDEEARQAVKLNENPLVLSLQPGESGEYVYQDVLFEDDSLQQNRTYQYVVKGMDFFGAVSLPSDTLTIFYHDYSPPLAPQGLEESINPEMLEIDLKWKNPPDPEVDSLAVYRTNDPDLPYRKITSLKAGTRQYTDRLKKAGFYYYYVASVDAFGNEGASLPVMVELTDEIPPAMPQQVIASADTGKLLVSWKPNSEPDLKGYLVFRAVAQGSKDHFILVNSTPSTEPYLEQKLPAQVKNTFQFRVVAVDSANNRSAMSDKASARMPDVTPPEIPRLRNVKAENDGILITWKPNTDYDLASYELMRSEDQTEFLKVNKQAILADQSEFLDKEVKAGYRYTYFVYALDSVGNRSLPSNEIQLILPAPFIKESINGFNVRFRKKRMEVEIRWRTIEAEDFLGFVLFRKEPNQTSLKPLTGLLKSQSEWTDKQVKKGLKYSYQIRSYWKNGFTDQSEIIQLSIKQ